MQMSADDLRIEVARPPLFTGEAIPGGCHFCLSRSALEKIRRDGPPWKYERFRSVPGVIEDPLVVFANLKREGYKDGLCYVAKPGVDGPVERAAEGYLFLVFVKKESWFVVFEWDWRLEDPRQPGFPTNWRNDFGGMAWQKM